MKILLIVLLFLGFYSQAQINVGSKEQVTLNPGIISAENLKKLRQTETVFVYRDSDTNDLETFKKTIDDAWDYTELKFVSYNELMEKKWSSKYSFFMINTYSKLASGYVQNSYVYLNLWMNVNGKKETFCRIELFPNNDAEDKISETIEKKKGGDLILYLYNEAKLYNWNMVYLKNALQTVDAKLDAGETLWLFNKSSDSDEMSKLKKKTLYVPAYILIKSEMTIGGELEVQHYAESDLFGKYEYNYKVISDESLSNLVLNTKEDIFYMSYVLSSSEKFISVVNARTGEIIYTNYQPNAYAIKKKDIAKMTKKIK